MRALAAPEVMAVDLDGTITHFALYNPKIKAPWFFFYAYVPFVLSAEPNRSLVEYLADAVKQGKRVIIVSARPVQFTNLSDTYLTKSRVPFTKLFCVGGGPGANERKLEIVLREGAGLVVDNDERALRFFRENNVRAVSVAELLTPFS